MLKEILKDQLKVLEQKLETLQKTSTLLNSENGETEETTTETFKCRKCDDTFLSMKSLITSHIPKIKCNNCDKSF